MQDINIPEDSNSVPPSPLKPDFTTETPLHTHKSHAIRKISFDPVNPDEPKNVYDMYNGKELVKVKNYTYLLLSNNNCIETTLLTMYTCMRKNLFSQFYSSNIIFTCRMTKMQVEDPRRNQHPEVDRFLQ